ncbi:MAG: carboxypeptidase regulatory-like domain-containing protein [Gammaproteobacteria bacterium]|nr:carboxypeptidase regulatory-like domain-containing protein [Gammaproteobacteria bacterium]
MLRKILGLKAAFLSTAFLMLLLCLPQAQAANTSGAHTYTSSIYSKAVPVTTPALRTLQHTNLPSIMRAVIGNRSYSQQQIDQLRQKLIAGGYIKPPKSPYLIPLGKLKPTGAMPQGVVSTRHLQSHMGQRLSISTGVVFPGIGVSDSPPDSIGCAPPDTDDAVGHDTAIGGDAVVEIVNTCEGPGVGSFKVWNASTGAVIQGTTSLAGMWSSGSGCDNGGGDNQVLYDQFAHVWLLSQFNNAYTGICLAVSSTDDPTGTYHLYNIVMDPNGFTDYPKVGIWVTGDANTDSYFVSANDFPPAACGNCVVYTAVQRSAALSGGTAGVLTVIGPSYTTGLDFSALPADVDGLNMAPLDDPEIYMDYISPYYYGGNTYALELWQMSVNWSANSASVTGPTAITVDPFEDGAIGCAPQPSPGECLPTLGDRLMFRLAYRNGYTGNSDQVLLVNHAVVDTSQSSNPIGIDWYELTAPSGSTNVGDWAIAQQALYSPADGNSRFMGSISMDHVGNIGLGYTISGPSVDPSVAVTGQDVGSPPGTMDIPENILIAGTGVQESTGRWGDYSSIMASATDDCTFWTAQEYISSTGSFHWSTGNGSFKFTNCSIGPEGTLAGTITDANTGNPISGAAVTLTPGNDTAVSNSSGQYTMTVPVGTYAAAASAFGYVTGTASGLGITQNQTLTQDFSLTPEPSATISGNVNDATPSGHAYGLYSEVKVTTPNYGQVADVWTSPTGAYSVSVPQGADYTLTATPYLPGYVAGTATVTNLGGDTSQNLGPTVGSSCSAPGYGFVNGFGENFDGGTFPPTGWTVTNDYSGSPIQWDTNANWNDQNYTNGTGVAATADSNNAASLYGYTGSYDTSLETPEIPVASLGPNPVLSFSVNYHEYSGNDALDVDVSGDGGTTWTTLDHITTNYGALYSTPGANLQVPLTIPNGATQIILRWRYYNLVSGFDWYAQIDNVSVGACTAFAGGLVYGQVTDQNTGLGLNGAAVSDSNSPANSTTTFTNTADPNLPPAYYFLFSDTNAADVITASYSGYTSGTATLNVTNDSETQQDFALGAPQFSINPTKFALHVRVGTQAIRYLTINNTGTGDGNYSFLTFDNAPPSMPTGGGAPLNSIHCQHLAPASYVFLAQTKGGSGLDAGCGIQDGMTRGGPNGSGWTALSNLPYSIMDDASAEDEGTGLLYDVGGYGSSGVTANANVYDPSTGTWTAIAPMPAALEKPAAAFIAGKLYVADGWTGSGNASGALYVYDPSTGAWTTDAASNPAPEGGGASVAVLNNQMYLMGGCPTGSSCGDTPFVAYNPATDSWTQLAPYPHANSWASCGAVAGVIYCAGGTAGSTEYADGYMYDASSNSWTAIAPIPVSSGGLWASGYIGNSLGLFVSGGVTANFSTVTNQGFVYTPGTNSWSALPNSNYTDYRGGSACGFYRVGGSSGGFTPTNYFEVLPGITPCGTSPIPWLSIEPPTGTVAAGSSDQLKFRFRGGPASGVKPFTVSHAYVDLQGTPYGMQMIKLQVHWDPMPVDLSVAATQSLPTVYVGGIEVYTVTVTNNQKPGHGPATQIALTYNLPAGANLLNTQGSMTCSLVSGVSTCDYTVLSQGQSVSETYFVVPSIAGTLNSTFSVTSRMPDDNPANNTTSISANVLAVAHVTLNSFTVNHASVPVGGQVTYNLGVGNQGPGNAKGVKITLPLPANMKFTGSSSGACSNSKGLVICNLGLMTKGGNSNVSITATAVGAGAVNTMATVSSTSRDPSNSNHSGIVHITVSPTAQPPSPRGGK